MTLTACLVSSGFLLRVLLSHDKLCLSRSPFPGDLFTVSPSRVSVTLPRQGIDFHSAALNFAIHVWHAAELRCDEAAFSLG